MNTTADRRAGSANESLDVIEAQEELVVRTQTNILGAMRRRGIKQSELAERLGVSQARVSQMFGDEARNLTLRTIAKIYHVMGSRCELVETAPDVEEKAAVASHSDAPRLDVAHVGTRGRFLRPKSASTIDAARRFALRPTTERAQHALAA